MYILSLRDLTDDELDKQLEITRNEFNNSEWADRKYLNSLTKITVLMKEIERRAEEKGGQAI